MYQFFMIIGLGLALPVSAANYGFPIDVEVLPQGTEISAQTTDLANMAGVTLTSRESEVLACQVAFVNGPERPVPRRVMLQPGVEVTLTQFFRRHINRIRVTVDCAAD